MLENKELEVSVHQYASKQMLKCIQSGGDMLQEALEYIHMQS